MPTCSVLSLSRSLIPQSTHLLLVTERDLLPILHFREKMFHELFGFPSFSISCFMLKHSFSSSITRNLMSWWSSSCSWLLSSRIALLLFFWSIRLPWGACEFSMLSETKNQPAIDVRRRSCSKNRTWTTTLRGSLSFWAACVQASRESFWQFMSRQSCSFSDSVSHGCDWIGIHIKDSNQNPMNFSKKKNYGI